MKSQFFKSAVAIVAAILLPALAQAAEGYATANVNMRAGPSTDFPAVTVIPNGRAVEIHGCLSDSPWCDVSFAGNRGWVSGQYVQAIYQNRRVQVRPDYYRPLGIPSVVFSLGSYWNNNYRNRDFYHTRDKWSKRPQVHAQQKPVIRQNNKPAHAINPRPSKNQPVIGKKRPNAGKVQPNAGNKRPIPNKNRPAAGKNNRPVQKVKPVIKGKCSMGVVNCNQ